MQFTRNAAEPADDEIRVESLRGRDWLVAPVVLVREGVLNGGFIAFEELQKSAPGWNGEPVTVPPAEDTPAAQGMPDDHRSGHPIDGQTDDGQPRFVSANQQPFIEDMHVGFLTNVEAVTGLESDEEVMSDRGLIGEAWIDVQRAEALGEFGVESVRRIAEGEPLDVSTGYFHRPMDQPGRYEGQRYEVEQKDLLPDHLALLPNERGACSWEDGCGASHPDAVANAIGDSDPDPEAETEATDPAAEAARDNAASAGLMAWVKSKLQLGASDGCSPGPCSCGEHEETGNTAADGADAKIRNESSAASAANDDTMTEHDIESLADRSAFEAETLEGWDEAQLERLSDTLEAAESDGEGSEDGESESSTEANSGGSDAGEDQPTVNEDLMNRIEALESRLEAEREDKRKALAETVAANTDHEAEDLAANTEDYPDPALEAMAEAVAADPARANAAGSPQGNRANYLAQAGAQESPDSGIDEDEYTANVGALSTIDGGE